MQEVVTDDNGGLDTENSLKAISNIFSYQGALDKCNETIRLYNKTVVPK
jgi:hypothetical protein